MRRDYDDDKRLLLFHTADPPPLLYTWTIGNRVKTEERGREKSREEEESYESIAYNKKVPLSVFPFREFFPFMRSCSLSCETAPREERKVDGTAQEDDDRKRR